MMYNEHAQLAGKRIIPGNSNPNATTEGGDGMGGPEILGGKFVWPFFVGAIGSAGAKAQQINMVRIFEALVIAAITAALTTWGNARAMDADLQAVKANQAQMQQDIREVRAILMQHAQ